MTIPSLFDPPPLTPRERSNANLILWKPGQSGNPGGKTSEQRQLEMATALRASKARAKLVAVLDHAIGGEEGFEPNEKTTKKVLGYVTTENLKLIKDSEDRGLGKPEETLIVLDADKPDELLLEETMTDLMEMESGMTEEQAKAFIKRLLEK